MIARGGQTRGQTLPDFAVGVALFLLAITFVVLFVPQVALPYEDQEQSVVAERVGSDLSNTLLADRASSKLDENCALAFFEAAGGDDEECEFDADDSMTERLGVASTYSVNVTLRTTPSDTPESELLCEENEAIGECDTGEKLRLGPEVPQEGDAVSVARKRVSVGDTQAVLEVGVW